MDRYKKHAAIKVGYAFQRVNLLPKVSGRKKNAFLFYFFIKKKKKKRNVKNYEGS